MLTLSVKAILRRAEWWSYAEGELASSRCAMLPLPGALKRPASLEIWTSWLSKKHGPGVSATRPTDWQNRNSSSWDHPTNEYSGVPIPKPSVDPLYYC